MINKKEFVSSIHKEIGIIKHLYTKIPAGALTYRPSEKQRTMLELLQYLSGIYAAAVKGVRAGNAAPFREGYEKSKSVTAEQFHDLMDAQAKEVEQQIHAMTEEELAGEVDLWGSGHKASRSALLLEMLIKMPAAYKMQLFLYIKASGNMDIGTSDLWRGVSEAKK